MQTNSQFCLWSKLLVTTLRRQDRDGYIIIIISSHGITMPNGLYFTAVFFLSSSVFRRPISEVTELISTKIRHIFTYDCYSKNLVRTPPGIYPHGLGQKNPLFGTDVNLWPNISLERNMISTIGKKCQSTRTLQSTIYTPPKFGEFWSTNSWERLAIFVHLLNFRIGRHCKPYRMHVITDSRQTLARVMQWHELTV